MVFSSLLFIFLYLPLVLIAYYVSPLKWRNAILLVLNLIFYAWGEPIYIVIMFASTIIDYTHGMLVRRCQLRNNDRGARMAVASSVFFNLALLFFFKYWDFIAGSLASFGLHFMPQLGISLPIGISFYTFQTMSYTIDVYRGDSRVQRNIIDFGTFVTLFPQLIAGPIVKYREVDDQLSSRTHSPQKFASGVQMFVIGLGKKVLLANSIGKLWDLSLATPLAELTTVGAWLGVLAFTFQIYFDFAGYSDMAIGLGRMLGFDFPINFNYPYIARSVTDFWRRWHISLSSWFREYLYIPLGGNRVSRSRLCLNLILVWAATGIWHGASWNFLLWGLYFGVLLILEKLFLGPFLGRLPAAVQHIYTLFLVMVSWAIFAVEDIGLLGGWLSAMFGFAQGGVIDSTVLYYLRNYLPMLIILALASTPLMAKFFRRLPEKPMKIAFPVLVMLGLIFSTGYLVDATYNPFLYFRF